MQRFVAMIMILLVAAASLVVPSARTAKALGLPGSEAGLASIQNGVEPHSQQRAAPAKPCPRGGGLLSCSFYVPSPHNSMPAFLAVAVVFAEAAAWHPRGRSVAPPFQPPKPLSA
jgi:hypothetical protein